MGTNTPPCKKTKPIHSRLKFKNMQNAELLAQASGDPEPVKLHEQLFKTKPIPGTPFNILNRDGKFNLTLGNNLMSEQFDNETDLELWMIENQWNITCTMICLLIEKLTKTNKN